MGNLLPQQEIQGGVVEIHVVEGKSGKIKIDNPQEVISNQRVEGNVVSAQDVGQALELQRLERGILLLQDLPGVDVTPTLKPGARVGESDLVLKVEPRPMFNASLGYANTGIRAVGLNQFSGTVAVNNAFGIGDQATLLVQGGSGNVFGRIGYSVPVGYSGLRVSGLPRPPCTSISTGSSPATPPIQRVMPGLAGFEPVTPSSAAPASISMAWRASTRGVIRTT